MEMYISGLARRAAKGLPIDSIASVASFFVSRVDTKVDGHLMGMIDRGGHGLRRQRNSWARPRSQMPGWPTTTLRSSSARSALPHSRAKGARVQRPLWASTGTKNPAYRDVVYMRAGWQRYSQHVPPTTLAAFLITGLCAPTAWKKICRGLSGHGSAESIGYLDGRRHG